MFEVPSFEPSPKEDKRPRQVMRLADATSSAKKRSRELGVANAGSWTERPRLCIVFVHITKMDKDGHFTMIGDEIHIAL